MAERGGVDSLNIVIGANTEALKKGLDDAVKAVQGTSQSLEKQAAKAQKSMERLLKGATDPGANLKQQNRNLTNLAGAYMQMGEQGSQAFREITQQAINARRQMEDVQDAIMAADMEGKAKLAAIGFGQATQAIAGMQGAMHLLGMDTKSAAEVTATLQSLMAMSAGIEGIVALEGTVTALTKSINGAAAAQKALNFLQSASGIGAVIAVITLAATAYALMAKKTYEVSQAMKVRNEIAEATSEKLKSEYGGSLALIAVLKDETQTRENRNAALKQLQQEYPGYLTNVDLDKTKSAELKKEIDKLNTSIYQRAKAQASLAKLSEIAAKELDLEIKRERDMQNLKATGMRMAGESASVVEGATKRERELLANTNKELSYVAQQREEILKIIKETGVSVDELNKKQTPAAKPGGGKSKAGIVPMQSRGLTATHWQAIGAMTEAQFMEAMTSNREFYDAYTGQNIHSYNEYLEDFKKHALDAVEYGNIIVPPKASEVVKTNFQKIVTQVPQLVADIGNALDSGIKQMAVNMAGALGDLAMNIVAGAEDPLAKFGDALLSTLAGFMQTLGQAMMAAGLASQKFQALLFTQPAGAIIAGAALIVAAGAVKGIMQKGIEGRQSKGSTAPNNQPQGIRPFADGGIISGPTLGLMGEYPGARSNPEVVAPLNKLKDMIGGGGNLTTRVSGQDLLIMLDRAETNRGRVR
jgi:hypothetical protein